MHAEPRVASARSSRSAPPGSREVRHEYHSSAEVEQPVDEPRFGRSGMDLDHSPVGAPSETNLWITCRPQGVASELRRAIPARTNTRWLPGLPLRWGVSLDFFELAAAQSARRSVGAEVNNL